MPFFQIKGVIPPMATPFTSEGAVDYGAFARNIERYNAENLAGYLVLGSNSETPFLEPDEKLELVRTAVKARTKGRIIMVGTGLESTAATIDLTNAAADLGADCALLLTPNYYGGAMGDDAQIAYFTSVADKSRIPILIYNVTKFTHLNISPRAVSTLSAHPNIIGMKDSSGNIAQLSAYMTRGLDKDFNLMVGTASAWYASLCMGIRGAVMALANCCPAQCAEIQRLYDAGDLSAARDLQLKVFPVNEAATATYGVAGLKYIMNKLGFDGGFVRAPLLEASEAAKRDMDPILQRAGLI